MQTFRILLFGMILFVITTFSETPQAPENSRPRATILSEALELFYDNEARGLLHYYEKSSEQEIMPEIFAELSEIISPQITSKNRSKMLLHVMRVLNMFHEHEKIIRFSILKGLSVEQIYYMIWRWRNAIYTSSYNGSLERIMEILRQEQNEISLFETLKEIEFEGIGIFLEAASSYNRLSDLLEFFTPVQQMEIAEILLKLICQEKSLDYTITLTELLLMSKNEELLRYISRKIMDAITLNIMPCYSEEKTSDTTPTTSRNPLTATTGVQSINTQFPETETISINAQLPETDITSINMQLPETVSASLTPELTSHIASVNKTEKTTENTSTIENLPEEVDKIAMHFFKLIISAYSHFFPYFINTENIHVELDFNRESEEIPAWLLSEEEIRRFRKHLKTKSSSSAISTTAMTMATEAQKEMKPETESAELIAAKTELRLFADAFVKNNPEYLIPDDNFMNSAHLFNEQKVHLQRHYFFGDTDGMVTFMVFQRIFANDPYWIFEEFPTYVKIHRKNPITGLQVIMLANKPRFRIKAEPHIQEELNKYGGGFHAFIFRGHSYNMHRVIRDITPVTRIAFLGSCGGFENLDTILHLSADAHIVYSKGTGTIWVNNTFLRELGNRLIVEPDINWAELREITREGVTRDLARRDIKDKILGIFDKYYIFPHENTGAVIIRKHMQMENDFPEIFGPKVNIEEPPGWLIIRSE